MQAVGKNYKKNTIKYVLVKQIGAGKSYFQAHMILSSSLFHIEENRKSIIVILRGLGHSYNDDKIEYSMVIKSWKN